MNSTLVSISSLAPEAKANQQDVAAVTDRLPEWFRKAGGTPRYSVDCGEYYVTEDDKHFIIGALWAATEQRQEARAAAADERLTNAYEALLNHPDLATAPAELSWQARMLHLFNGVADALRELVDAKVDAKTMSPVRAERIRAEADALQRAAETNVQAALRKAVRMAHSH